jgi:hypothetical protein
MSAPAGRHKGRVATSDGKIVLHGFGGINLQDVAGSLGISRPALLLLHEQGRDPRLAA